MNEVLFTSSSGDAVVSVNVWDSKTCANLMSYRGGGIINPKGLSLLGSDYVIGVEKSKPLLQVWPINSQQPLNSPRLLCPGKISVMSCSPDSFYIAVGVDEKLHIYQVSSGCLVGSGVRHFQPITVVRWSNDGDILACGGEDGMITVWSLSNLLNKESQQVACDPRFILSDHSLPVTDLLITCGGSTSCRSRLISVSSDRTCKIYDLATGKILLSVVFVEMLTSVSIGPSEMEIFVGCTSGDVNEFSLRNPKNVNSPEIHISTGILTGNSNAVNVYKGHKKSVTCLSVSIDGKRLLSGSLDESVRIWHIISKQCLKILNIKGPVTNAFFICAPKQMFEQDVKRKIILCPFQKTQLSNDACNEYSLEIVNYNDLDTSCYDLSVLENANTLRNRSLMSEGHDNYSMQNEINRLQNINEKLYKISVQRLLQNRVNNNIDDSVVSSEERRVDKDNEKNFIIENIFDNLISYQKQPNLKNKKKKKNLLKIKEKDEEVSLSMHSKLALRKMKNKKKDKKRSSNNNN